MIVDPNLKNTLISAYWGTDNRGRVFDIFVDNVKIETGDLNKYKENRFYPFSFTTPLELTKGKTKALIKLLPKAVNSARPVYGSRLIEDWLANTCGRNRAGYRSAEYELPMCFGTSPQTRI